MSSTIAVFDEPELEFANGQRVVDPHDGLSLFGPYDKGKPSQPRSLVYGVIGLRSGIDLFGKWSQVLNSAQISADVAKHQLWPPYPGFEAVTGAAFPNKPAWTYEIDSGLLSAAVNNQEPHVRASKVVQFFIDAFTLAKKRDENFSIFICVIPDIVFQNCRAKSVVKNPVGEKLTSKERNQRRQGQGELFSEYDPDDYHYSVDFRRQLKAKAMEYGVPIQILRETTLRPNDEYQFGERQLTPLSDRAWNLTTALYYKAGGKPWRLATARKGVCYLGIAFRMTAEDNATACCAAQMFLDSGDGIVFLGDYGPWYSEEKKQFSLTGEAAYNLLSGILRTYTEMEGQTLTEVFLHSRSSISIEEFLGYQRACPAGVSLVGVRIRDNRDGFRLFRPGTRPVLRGTFLQDSAQSGYLWAHGFKPRLMTYDGNEVPAPLRIDIQHGNADIVQVAKDVFSLSKLNYNTCKLGEAQPVTVHFSDAVGEILVNNPRTKRPHHSFKFYI